MEHYLLTLNALLGLSTSLSHSSTLNSLASVAYIVLNLSLKLNPNVEKQIIQASFSHSAHLNSMATHQAYQDVAALLQSHSLVQSCQAPAEASETCASEATDRPNASLLDLPNELLLQIAENLEIENMIDKG
jgi:hypothetical protein